MATTASTATSAKASTPEFSSIATPKVASDIAAIVSSITYRAFAAVSTYGPCSSIAFCASWLAI